MTHWFWHHGIAFTTVYWPLNQVRAAVLYSPLVGEIVAQIVPIGINNKQTKGGYLKISRLNTTVSRYWLLLLEYCSFHFIKLPKLAIDRLLSKCCARIPLPGATFLR